MNRNLRSTVLWEIIAIAAVIIVAVALRWERLGTRNLWPDEAFSLDLAQRAFPELLAELRSNDAHPLGYYALLSLWIRAFGGDLARMRALSALFGLASVVLTWRLGRRLFSPAVGVGGAALVALNPFQIFASNELRMYMPLEFGALVSIWLLWRAHAASSASTGGFGWWIAYGASLALMAYLSYYAFLIIPAHALWLLLWHPRRWAVGRMAIACAVALVVYAPWIPYVASLAAFLRGNPLFWRGQGLWATYLPEVVASQTFGGYLFNALSYHSSQGLALKYYGPLLIPFIGLAAVGAVALGKIDRPARSLVALSWVVPIGLVMVASLVLGKVAAYHYHLNFLQPFLALFVAAGVIHMHEVVPRVPAGGRIPATAVTLAATIAVLAFVAPAIKNLQWNRDYQFYRYDSAARLVKNLYQAGDVVVFMPRAVSRGFHFYFDPPGKEFGIPLDRGRYSREALRRSIQEVARTLTVDDKKVWLVYSPPFPPGSLEDLLSAFQDQGYKRADVNDFKGIRVGLLVRPVR